MAKTKTQIIEELTEAGIEFDAQALKPELEELLEGITPADELDARRQAAPSCHQCGRSRLDGHIHGGI